MTAMMDTLAEDANVSHQRALLTTAQTLREKADHLRDHADQLDNIAAQIEAGATGGIAVQWIRGREIVDRLKILLAVDEELHYTQMLNELTLAGYRPAGVDAGGTLLAALYRSEDFERVGRSRSGLYRRIR